MMLLICHSTNCVITFSSCDHVTWNLNRYIDTYTYKWNVCFVYKTIVINIAQLSNIHTHTHTMTFYFDIIIFIQESHICRKCFIFFVHYILATNFLIRLRNRFFLNESESTNPYVKFLWSKFLLPVHHK